MADGSIPQEILQQLMAAQQGGAGQQQVDPRLDNAAKQFAMMKGSPREKYAMFVQLFPALIQELTQQQGQQQPNPMENYQVQDNMKVAMPGGGY